MIITDLKEERKNKVMERFFKKFGTLKLPDCMRCIKKVDVMGVDYCPIRDEIIVFVECHGDREECRAPVSHIMKQDFIQMRGAFHPKASTREGGILIRDIH